MFALFRNSADEGFDGTYHTNIVVKSNGSCLYVPPGKIVFRIEMSKPFPIVFFSLIFCFKFSA